MALKSPRYNKFNFRLNSLLSFCDIYIIFYACDLYSKNIVIRFEDDTYEKHTRREAFA